MKYHYLSHEHRQSFPNKDIYILEYKNEPIGYCSVQYFPHSVNKKIKKVHRLVIRPDYQGLGIGIKFLEFVANRYIEKGFDFRITTSSLSLLNGLKKRNNWICTAYNKGKSQGTSKLGLIMSKTASIDRYIGTFRFIKK